MDFWIFLKKCYWFFSLVSDKVDFLHAFKPESFLQIGSMILDGDGQEFPKLLK